MGEIICEHCGYMNWHVYCHATGLCEECMKRVVWCEGCNASIPEGGETWAKAMLRIARETKKELEKEGVKFKKKVIK